TGGAGESQPVRDVGLVVNEAERTGEPELTYSRFELAPETAAAHAHESGFGEFMKHSRKRIEENAVPFLGFPTPGHDQNGIQRAEAEALAKACRRPAIRIE